MKCEVTKDDLTAESFNEMKTVIKETQYIQNEKIMQ